MSDVRDFRLPDLGEGLEEGEIVEWHVAVGDVVELNQTVADVETAKAVVAVPSPFAGTVVERLGEVGEPLEVGSVLLRIEVATGTGADDVDGSEVSPAQGGFETGEVAAAAAVPDADGAGAGNALDADEEPQPLVGYGQGKAGGGRRPRRRRGGSGPDAGAAAAPLAKPPVRKLAKDLGVDLASLAPGSGPGQVITREDVEAAAAGTAPEGEPVTAGAATSGSEPTPEQTTGRTYDSTAEPRAVEVSQDVPGFRGRRPGEVEQIRGIRKRIVEKMETSRREIPEATCSRDADLTELWELRHLLTEQARDEGSDVRITPFALILRATVLALRRFPTLNARIDRPAEGDGDAEGAGRITLLEHINLGFAADTDRGLVVPNIKDAHTRSTLQLATELADLAEQARNGRIGPADLTGGTFTVNNYGAFGADDGDPIINHPEAAILGVGAIRERPWVVPADPGGDGSAGRIAVRRVARFTLAFDHRVCDGGEAGRFVSYVADLCEQPGRLLLHL